MGIEGGRRQGDAGGRREERGRESGERVLVISCESESVLLCLCVSFPPPGGAAGQQVAGDASSCDLEFPDKLKLKTETFEY